MTDIEADGVGSETLALRKELGSGSYVTGSARCWNRAMVEAWVTSMFQVEMFDRSMGEIGLQLDSDPSMIDISITERVRFWVLCDGECKMLEQGYGEAWVTSMFQGPVIGSGFPVRDISITEELGSGSYVTGSARCWNRAMLKGPGLGLGFPLGNFYAYDTFMEEFCSNSDGECEVESGVEGVIGDINDERKSLVHGSGLGVEEGLEMLMLTFCG
ncbi:Coagulation Factor Xiii A Chain [Manis pentadactyla]|nr:Coagulation Factor Xiii A Chain [Manis pentadactyla]